MVVVYTFSFLAMCQESSISTATDFWREEAPHASLGLCLLVLANGRGGFRSQTATDLPETSDKCPTWQWALSWHHTERALPLGAMPG